MDLRPGLYEALVTVEVAALLEGVPDDLADRRALATAEAADRIALYLSGEIKRALADVADDDRVAVSQRRTTRLTEQGRRCGSRCR